MWLSLILSASASDNPWWEERSPCPKGATLEGAAHTGPVTAPDPAFPRKPGAAVWCQIADGFEGRHGRYTGWYAHGQMSDDATYDNGVNVALTAWSPLGHVELERTGPDAFLRTLSYADGSKALHGALDGKGRPTGTWVEWDANGVEIASATYTDGTTTRPPDASLVHHVDDLDRMVVPPPEVTLPRSTATEAFPLAVSVVISTDQLIVDGLVVARLDEGALTETRGSMVPPLYDLLVDKAQAAKEIEALAPAFPFTGGVVVLADADTPWPTLRDVVYTAGQAQFRTFYLAVDSGLQWPPVTGPVQGDRLLTAIEMELPELGPDAPTWPSVQLGEPAPAPGPGIVLVPHDGATYADIVAGMDQLRPTHPSVVLGAAP